MTGVLGTTPGLGVSWRWAASKLGLGGGCEVGGGEVGRERVIGLR